MQISLMFGTETGNAEMLCDDIQDHLEGEHEVDVADLQNVDPSTLDTARFHIFVCSTYGEGDLPQSALPFAEKLASDQPDLSDLKFSVFGLGDSAYEETFANGSNVLIEALTKAGGTMIGPKGIHDASGLEDAEDIALPWASERLAEASAFFS